MHYALITKGSEYHHSVQIYCILLKYNIMNMCIEITELNSKYFSLKYLNAKCELYICKEANTITKLCLKTTFDYVLQPNIIHTLPKPGELNMHTVRSFLNDS